ncbi:TPA: hypothetical protein KPJ62_003691 [Clostridioides difficile]|nr:hypothetical protein [Clostridioides difficile]
MEDYSYKINKNLFSFSFINNTDEKSSGKEIFNLSHYILLEKVLNFMKKRGFNISNNNNIKFNSSYKSKKDIALRHLSNSNNRYWTFIDHNLKNEEDFLHSMISEYSEEDRGGVYGIKENLEFISTVFKHGFLIQFFQSNNLNNKLDSYYFEFDRASYLTRLMYINETKKIAEFIENLVPEARHIVDIDFKLAINKIKYDYVMSKHHSQNDICFDLGELDGTTCDNSLNNVDRDNKTIFNGDIKYFRYNGRLQRVKVYHNINSFWWGILNNTECVNVLASELFNPTKEEFKCRRYIYGNSKL